MNVLITAAARNDLRDIGEWLTLHYPAVAPHAERRFRDAFARIGRWPESGPHSAGREGVRVMPLGRYPYKIFYRITGNAVEILHIHHAARAPWDVST
jgi:plasmid stabilization system protein ParE